MLHGLNIFQIQLNPCRNIILSRRRTGRDRDASAFREYGMHFKVTSGASEEKKTEPKFSKGHKYNLI